MWARSKHLHPATSTKTLPNLVKACSQWYSQERQKYADEQFALRSSMVVSFRIICAENNQHRPGTYSAEIFKLEDKIDQVRRPVTCDVMFGESALPTLAFTNPGSTTFISNFRWNQMLKVPRVTEPWRRIWNTKYGVWKWVLLWSSTPTSLALMPLIPHLSHMSTASVTKRKDNFGRQGDTHVNVLVEATVIDSYRGW